MTDTPSFPSPAARLLTGFIAGFLATLVFHQLTLSLLWAIKLAPFGPFAMTATQPFGVPAVFSLAFFGGLWGILFVLVDRRFPAGFAYWPVSFLFGAIFPSLVALLVVLPLKGKPMGGGWHPPLLITAFLINGAWGLGTALLVRLFSRRPGRS